jgi:hypothetical protein
MGGPCLLPRQAGNKGDTNYKNYSEGTYNVEELHLSCHLVACLSKSYIFQKVDQTDIWSLILNNKGKIV